MPVSPHIITRFSGLYLSINPIAGVVPEGAFEVANNLVVRSTDILEPRRGYYASSAAPEPVNGGEVDPGDGGTGGVGPFVAGCPPFSVDNATGVKTPGTVYGPSDGVTPITLFSGITVDPSLGMLGYPPAGKYYVVLGGPFGGLAWYDETGTVAGGVSDGCSPGLWSMHCYAGGTPQGDPADPSTWTCSLIA